MVLIVAVAAMLIVPIMAIAADRFTDVPTSNVFHDDIGWLAGAGITLGCNPPTNDEFCPDDAVKRQQMAAFLRRFAAYIGAEDGTPAQADNATTADSATTADDADMLGGLAPDAYDTFIVSESTSPFLDLSGGATEVLTTTVSPTAASNAAVNAVIGLSYNGGADGIADISAWVEVDNTTCDTTGAASPFYVATVADGGLEPLLATLSIAGGTELAAGSHTLTVCAQGGTAAAETVGINVVVSPSAASVVTAAAATVPSAVRGR